MPVTLCCCDETTVGTSTIFVAETFIPFLKAKASTIWPSTLNFWSLGILNSWFVLSSSVRITDVGGLTCQTLPVTVWIVVTIMGVVVVMIVRWSFMPGLQVVNAKLFPINRGSGRLGDIRKMPEGAIFHFHDQIISVHRVNFAAVDRNGVAARAPCCRCSRLDLRAGLNSKC